MATGLAESESVRLLDELAEASLPRAHPDGRFQFHDHMRRACSLSEEFDFWSPRMPARNGLGKILRASGRSEEALSVYRELLVDPVPSGGRERARTLRARLRAR